MPSEVITVVIPARSTPRGAATEASPVYGVFFFLDGFFLVGVEGEGVSGVLSSATVIVNWMVSLLVATASLPSGH